ncbi:Inactive serine protease scarface [Anthophora plagiata]
MLVGALILITTIFSTNGSPASDYSQARYKEFQNSDQVAILQNPEQQQVLFETPEEQQVILQIPEQQDVIYENDEQKINQESINGDYFPSGNSDVSEQADFTISCTGDDKLCTNKNDCLNGYISFAKSAAYSSLAKVQQCRVLDQVCCTIDTFEESAKQHYSDTGLNVDQSSVKYDEATEFKSGGASQAGSFSQADFEIAIPIQLGCAAALLCVEEKFCTIDGTISPEPVTLSSKQFLRRVPLSTCKNPDNGIIGKCCRDPNYVDPWPTNNLPENYTGGFDEQGFPTFLNLSKVKPPTKTIPKTRPPQQHDTKTEQKLEPTLIPENSNVFTKTLIPPSEDRHVKNNFNIQQSELKCGVRNKVLQQSNTEESITSFAEIPWQAMVLHSVERKILCSGALVDTQHVLTAANCIESLSPNDISIKLGEWKLGYELKHEEPLPFEIINVSSISLHPGYTRGLGKHDLAILHLEKAATVNLHINPLCLPETNELVQNNRLCIATGWGKSILQAHYAGAVMHAVSMKILSTEYCTEQLANLSSELNAANGIICVTPKEEKNNICETDVGGPLACQNENGLYELTGIYSQDTGCLPSNEIAIFAQLDEKWLKKTMHQPAPEESEISVNYRKSSLNTDNQYLPPN